MREPVAADRIAALRPAPVRRTLVPSTRATRRRSPRARARARRVRSQDQGPHRQPGLAGQGRRVGAAGVAEGPSHSRAGPPRGRRQCDGSPPRRRTDCPLSAGPPHGQPPPRAVCHGPGSAWRRGPYRARPGTPSSAPVLVAARRACRRAGGPLAPPSPGRCRGSAAAPLGGPGDVSEQHEGRGIGPVQVVEDEDRWRLDAISRSSDATASNSWILLALARGFGRSRTVGAAPLRRAQARAWRGWRGAAPICRSSSSPGTRRHSDGGLR